jgi:hypothetical protein
MRKEVWQELRSHHWSDKVTLFHPALSFKGDNVGWKQQMPLGILA